MRRRIVLAVFVIVTSAATIIGALWYAGVFEERACKQGGGEWVAIRKICVQK